MHEVSGLYMIANQHIARRVFRSDDNGKQFTHRRLQPLVLWRALMTDDKRTTCRFNAVVHVSHVLRQLNDTQQLSVSRAVLT